MMKNAMQWVDESDKSDAVVMRAGRIVRDVCGTIHNWHEFREDLLDGETCTCYDLCMDRPAWAIAGMRKRNIKTPTLRLTHID